MKRGEKMSEETKRKISERSKKRFEKTEERTKLSKSLVGKPKPWLKGKRHSEETCRKRSESLKGRTFSEESIKKMREAAKHRPPMSEETKRKIGESNKGKICIFKGKKRSETSGEKHPFYGKHHSEETRKQMSVKRKGKKPWNIGKSGTNLGKTFSEEHKQKIGASNRGKTRSEETRRKISKSHKGLQSLEKHPMWKGGISFEPYCPKFNFEFKERVRRFFNFTCQMCGHVWQEGEKRLSVHHVNYDKMVCCNDVKPLFVTVCHTCHVKTQFNREYWEEVFTNKILLEYDGECYMKEVS